MRKTSILLLRAFLGPLAVTFPVALFVLDMQIIWVYADEFIGKGLETWVLIKLVWFASARIVNLALPLAILVASIMALGNLSGQNELTAMKSAGMTFIKIIRPLIIIMLLISGGALWFSSSAWPMANVKFRAILYSVTRQRPALNIRPGVFYTGIEGFAIKIEEKDSDGLLTDILIHDHRNPEMGASRVIRASSGTMHHDSEREELVIELINGTSYEEQSEGSVRKNERMHPHITASFQSQTIRIDLSSLNFDLADEGLFKRSYEMMSLPQLQVASDSILALTEDSRVQLVDYGRRAVKLFKDSLELTENSSSNWLSVLTRVERNNVISSAKELSRNQAHGIENALEIIDSKYLRRDRHLIEWHRKFILAISCFVLFFVGSSLGAIVKKGGIGLPVVMALVVFIIYYIISMVGEQMVKSGTLTPVIGMWLSTLVLVPIAAILTFIAVKGKTPQVSFSIRNLFKK